MGRGFKTGTVIMNTAARLDRVHLIRVFISSAFRDMQEERG